MPWVNGDHVGGAAMGIILVPTLLYFLYGTWRSEYSRQPQAAEMGVKGIQGEARPLPA